MAGRPKISFALGPSKRRVRRLQVLEILAMVLIIVVIAVLLLEVVVVASLSLVNTNTDPVSYLIMEIGNTKVLTYYTSPVIRRFNGS